MYVYVRIRACERTYMYLCANQLAPSLPTRSRHRDPLISTGRIQTTPSCTTKQHQAPHPLRDPDEEIPVPPPRPEVGTPTVTETGTDHHKSDPFNTMDTVTIHITGYTKEPRIANLGPHEPFNTLDLTTTHTPAQPSYITIQGHKPLNTALTPAVYGYKKGDTLTLSIVPTLPGGGDDKRPARTKRISYSDQESSPPPKKKRRSPRTPPPTILSPLRQRNGTYHWPHISTGTSKQRNNAGKGLIYDAKAAKRLPANTYIPIIGRLMTRSSLAEMNPAARTHIWAYTGRLSELGLANGNPETDPTSAHHAAAKGLGIAMMANEPSGGRPNCIFKRNCLVTTRPIVPGEELTVYYGSDYNRDYTIDLDEAATPDGLLPSNSGPEPGVLESTIRRLASIAKGSPPAEKNKKFFL